MPRFAVPLLFLLISCSSRHANDIAVISDIRFRLHEGELVAAPDKLAREVYTKNFNSGDVQIPLFRYVRHKRYTIYVGMPYQTSMADMLANLPQPGDSMLMQTSDAGSFSRSFRRKGMYMTQCARNISGTLLFVAAIAGEPASMDTAGFGSVCDRLIVKSD